MYEITNFSANVSVVPRQYLFDPTPTEIRESVTALAEQMASLPQVDVPVIHEFLDGIYVRTVKMAAGSIIVGKIHKQEHIAIISKGRATVLTEHGVLEIEAPYVFKSPPGARRALRIHEDMVWSTIHRTDHTDLRDIEEQLIAKDFDDPVLAELEKRARGMQ